LISENIKWREIDDNICEAIFTNKGVDITARLYFNEAGELINFTSNDRYDTSTESQIQFSTPAKKYTTINDHYLCHYGEATWHYPEGDFVYGKFNLIDIEYNVLSIR